MKKIIFLCILGLCLKQLTYAQVNRSIIGQVILNNTAESLKKIKVNWVSFDNKIKQVCLSDDSGFFRFSDVLSEGKIIVNEYGYKFFERKADTDFIYIVLEENIYTLNGVVVTAGKSQQKITDVTVSMETLKPKLLENTNSIKMDAALENSPGVNIVFGQANIRGGSGFSYGAGSRVLMLVDDLPILSADAGDIKWDALPVENIKQIEIIKGASSALFGSGAMGGVINIRTADASKTPITKVNLFAGVYDNPLNKNYKYRHGLQKNLGFNIFHSQTINNTGITIALYNLQDDGYRKYESFENRRFSGSIRQKFKKIKGLQIGLNASYFTIRTGNFLFWKQIDSPYIPAAGTASLMYNKRSNIDPFIEYTSPKKFKISLRSRIYITENNSYNAEITDSIGIHTTGKLYYNELQFQKYYSNFEKNLKSTFTSGVVYTFNKIISDSFYQNHHSINSALYFQYDLKYKKLNISSGVRFEYNQIDNKKSETLPIYRGGFSYEISKYTFIRGSYGTAYRFPSVAERFINTSASVVRVLPNPNIESETGRSGEIGFKQGLKIGKWMGYTDLALFSNQYTNMVDFIYGIYTDPNDTNNLIPGFKTINTSKKAQINGLEISLSGEGKIKQTNIILLAGYTFIEPLYKDSVFSESAKQIPYYNYLQNRFRHTWKVNADIEYKNFSSGITFRYNSFMLRVNDVLEAIIPGSAQYRNIHNNGFSIIDFRVGYLYKKHKFSLIVKNAMNTEYIYYLGNMGSPRNFVLQYLYKI